MELKFFTTILDSPKWKVWKKRPDTTTFTAKDEHFYAVKICGAVRASQKSLQEYARANRIIRASPNFVKGGVVRVYNDVNSDLLVTYKTDSRFGTTRDYWFSKHDFEPVDNQVVSVVWCLENQRKSAFSSLPTSFFTNSTPAHGECISSNYWGAFKAVGCIIQPLQENPQFCSLIIIFKLDRKVLQSSEGIDVYLYKLLQRIRAETETPEVISPIAIALARNADVSRTGRNDITRNSAEF